MAIAGRFVLVVVSSAVYFGLAIWGWGGLSFFSNPARLAIAIVAFAMALVAMFAGGNVNPGVREDRGNRWVLVVFTVVGLVDGFLPAYTDRIDFWTIDGDSVRWLGVILFAAGGALRLWPVFVLGDRFSGLVAIQPGHTLVTTGIYRVIRNPSYLGLLLTALGWALGFRSGVGVLLFLLLLPPLVARMRAEERLLSQEFGDEYLVYVKRTARLIPGLY